MKKLLSIVLTLIICTAFAACSNGSQNEPTQSLHVLLPTDAVTEPEWCPVDCDIYFADSNGEKIISSEDFDTFALIGSSDADCALRFKLTDMGKDMLSAYFKANTASTLNLFVGDEQLSKVALSESVTDGEFDIKDDYTYEQICQWATVIRGL